MCPRRAELLVIEAVTTRRTGVPPGRAIVQVFTPGDLRTRLGGHVAKVVQAMISGDGSAEYRHASGGHRHSPRSLTPISGNMPAIVCGKKPTFRLRR